MNSLIKMAGAAALAALVLAPLPAEAGRSCTEHALSAEDFTRADAAAARLKTALDTSGAEVAMVGRVGSDVSKWGITYTHSGFFLKQADGNWEVVHVLNRCQDRTSELYRQGLVNFFLDDPYSYDAVILIPAPDLQAELRRVIESRESFPLHAPLYSAVAYPFATRYGNSNSWILETIALAEADIEGRPFSDRAGAQTWLRLAGYRGTVIRLSVMERIGAGFRPNVTYADHPEQDSNFGRMETVTVESMRDWLRGRGRLAGLVEVPG
jgi:hypothetical protein